MAYTVKQLARMSGVSVRTLHFYDEVGLLEPAYVGSNGYRFYEEPQLLKLQQILFYRRLRFELKQIKKILGRPDFDKITALKSHRKVLVEEVGRTEELIRTIDKTIKHLKGTKKMKGQELFEGFDPEVQAKHEQDLIDRFGDKMKEEIAQSKVRVKDWTQADWEKAGMTFNQICAELVAAMKQNLAVESAEVQKLVRRHYNWLKLFWTPTRERYKGHTMLILDSDLRKAYEAFDPDLPEFIAMAINVFADRELS